MKEFKQSRFIMSKKVTFKDDGISYYSGNFFNAKETFFPFEEIYPNTITRECKTNKLFLWVAVTFGLILILTLSDIFRIGFAIYMVLVFFSTILFIIFLVLTILSRRKMIYLSTLSGYLIDFYDKNPSEELLAEFLDTLKSKIHEYLKKKFSVIDEDVTFEKHIENFNYLKEMEIIDQEEYEKLKEELKNKKSDN